MAGLIVFIPLIAGGILALASRKERAATRVTYMALGTSPPPAPHYGNCWRRAGPDQAGSGHDTDAVDGRGVLSVRTGNDYHDDDQWPFVPFYQAYTFVLIPPTYTEWQNAPWSTRRAYVDTALKEGRTVASRHGGFARLAVNGNLPGAVLRNMPKNTSLNLNIRFRPVRSGIYRLEIFRNANEFVWSWTDSFQANTLWTTNVTTSFPGRNSRILVDGGGDHKWVR